MSIIRSITIPLCLATSLSLAHAQTVDPIESLRKAIAGNGGGQISGIANAVSQLRSLFRNRDFFEQSDVTFAKTLGDARMRASLAGRMLAYDLNGDLEVSREELAKAIGAELSFGDQQDEQRQLLVQKRVDVFMLGDANQDGKLSGKELYAVPPDQGVAYQDPTLKIAQALLDADPDRDGKITQTELFNLLGRASEGYQATLEKMKQQMLDDQLARQTPVQRAQNAASCFKDKASDKAKIAYVNVREGTTLSPIALVGQDEVTRVINVTISDEPEPLVLVLVSAESVLWNLKGATGRIEKIITETDRRGQNASGVVGVDKEKITFSPSGGCLHYLGSNGIADQAMDKGKILQMFGRLADSVTYAYSVKQLQLPSGKAEQSTNIVAGGGDIAILKTDHVGPLVDDNQPEALKVEDVITSGKAVLYEVLPQQAGIDQLIKAGKLEKARNGYRILDKMRFPAGLFGNLQFVLAKGVPMPEGNPGNSCVVSEETGKIITGTCR